MGATDNDLSETHEAAEIDAAAVDWVVRLDGGAAENERHAFEHWIARDSAHAAAFARAHEAWKAASFIRDPSRERPRREALFRSKAGWACAAALATFLLLGAMAWLPFAPTTWLAADHATAIGVTRTVILPDGSAAELDGGSAIAVRFDDYSRKIEVLAGRVLFSAVSVTAAERRPFVVAAAEGIIRALGTKFVVAREDGRVGVFGVEHQIEVTYARADEAQETARTVILSPGDRVSYDHAGLGRVETLNVEVATAWRRGRLIFDGMRLRDAVAEINRYHPGRIIVLGDALAERRVSGVFDVTRIDRAVDIIAAELGVSIATIPLVATVIY